MAIAKIDLSPERKDWADAEYGEEVRAAGISSLQKTEDVINGTVQQVNQAAEDVKTTTAAANSAVQRANATIDHADDVLEDATAQATASAASAKTSQSWAVGGTGGRQGEDTNNSEYFSRQSETSAEAAKNEADRASMYADFVTPDFILENNRLYINNDSTVDFKVYDNKLYIKLPA